MAERFDIFPQTIESGTRTFGDGSEYVELRFADEVGRMACILILPEALDRLLQQLQRRPGIPGKMH